MISIMAGINSEEATTFPIVRITSAIEPTISSGVLREKWSSLARALGLTNDSIKKIRSDIHLDKISLSDAIHEIIEDWHGRCGSVATVDKLINAFQDLDFNSVGEKLRLEFSLPCKGSDNPSLSWNEIGIEFQRKVESSLENFYPSIQFDNESKSKLQGEVLVELMTGKEPSPIKNIIPEALKYYVPRTLVSRNVLTEGIFERSSDNFLFTGIERHVLSSKAGSQRTDTTSSQLNSRDLDVKHMLMDMPSHFSKFHSSNSAVHHIKFEDDTFYWAKSIGSLCKLRRFVDKSQVRLNESDFLYRICSLSVSNLPVCISDSPGMGKSEILKQIAKRIAKVLPDRFVIFQEFPKFVDIVERHSNVICDLHNTIQIALQDLACKNELEVRLLNSKLNSKTTTVELLLDGYDELNWTSLKTANDILREIHSSLKSIRLWVTTRPHLLDNLENMFTVLGYTIQSFTPENQINFLTSYWSRAQDLNLARLTKYATNCMEQLKSTLSAKEEDIAGIPLQCYMIGEVYEEEARDYSRSEVELICVKIRISTITELYKLMIEKKLQKYQSTYGSEKVGDQALINMHIRLSLKLLFPEYFEKVESVFEEIRKDDVLNVGILESKGNEAELIFIHRTFAEYFAAVFHVNLLGGEYIHDGIGHSHGTGNLSEVFLCQQSGTSNEFKYNVICFFINSLLPGKIVQENIPQPFAKLFNAAVSVTQLARACVAGNLINIFSLLYSVNLFGKDIFNKDLTLEAIKLSGVQLIKKTIDGFQRFHNFDYDFAREVLRNVVKRGEFSLVEFVFNEQRFKTIMGDVNTLRKIEIVHCCVQNSKQNSDEIIRQKIEVIQFLVMKSHLILEEKNLEGNTPLLCENVHVRLLVKLIELGSNVFAKNNRGETILHFTDFIPNDYHLLLTSIKRVNLVELVSVKEGGDCHLTPLLTLIRAMDPEVKSIDVFQETGADFNVHTYYKCTSHSLLAFAISHGRNATTLRKLVQCGSDVRWRAKDGGNLLHFATSNSNLDAVYILFENDVDPNAVDNNLDTPLHAGARNQWNHDDVDNFLKITKAVLERGGNAVALNSNGNTFIHLILYNAKHTDIENFDDIVKLLIQLNRSSVLEVENIDGISPLVLALQNLDVEEEALSLLHEHGVNLLKSTNVRRSEADNTMSAEQHVADYNLLHVACQNAKYKVVPFLLQIGLNVNAKDFSGMSPLQYAVSGCILDDDESENGENEYDYDYPQLPLEYYWKTIKALIENGADVNSAVDSYTFLHVLLSRFHELDEHFQIFFEFLVKNDCIKLFNTHGKGGLTPLHLAVQLKDFGNETISYLQANGVNFDSVDDDGNSVLVYAIAARKSRDFLENVIGGGANAKQTNNNEQNLLHVASDCHSVDLIEFIVKLGIDVNAIDINGDAPLHLCLKYKNGELDVGSCLQVAISLVRNGGSVITVNKEGQSPFSIAKTYVHENKELLPLFADRLTEEKDQLDEDGNTVLHTAVSGKDVVLVQELVKIGANVNSQNKKLQTPLHVTSLNADEEHSLAIIIFLIISNADLVKKDANDCTFLHILLRPNNNLEPAYFHSLTDYLIRNGQAMVFNIAGWNNGTTPIHVALLNLDVDLRTVTALAPHVNWNLADSMGKTPLFYATCRRGNSSLLPELVSLGADYEHLDNFGNSMLHAAAEHGNIDGIKYFISLGLNVNAVNLYGNTPLHVALLLGRENVVEMLHILTEAGGDSNLKNKIGQTPFLIIAKKFYSS